MSDACVGRPAAFEPVGRRRHGAPDRAARLLLRRHAFRSKLRVVLVVLPGERRLARGELVVGQLVALTEIRGALQRHPHHVRARPEALQVGIAPRGAGRRVRAVRLKPDATAVRLRSDAAPGLAGERRDHDGRGDGQGEQRPVHFYFLSISAKTSRATRNESTPAGTPQ